MGEVLSIDTEPDGSETIHIRVPLSIDDAGYAELQKLGYCQRLVEAHVDAERRIAAEDPYGPGVDRDQFKLRYGI